LQAVLPAAPSYTAHAVPRLFQTGWFVEPLLSQVLVVWWYTSGGIRRSHGGLAFRDQQTERRRLAPACRAPQGLAAALDYTLSR
jgi:hypothetical protein